MAHDTLLFNLHDLTLLFAVSQYILLAAFLFFTRRRNDKSIFFLILILLLNALMSADVFMIWSDSIRRSILAWQPNIFFWGGLGFLLQGPLLYWYISSVLYRDFKFKLIQLLHLMPLVIVFVVLYWNYYSLPHTEQVDLMQDLQFMFSELMSKLVTFRYLSVIVYGGCCFYLLYRYHNEVRQQYADYCVSERKWLRWIVIGVVGISAWSLFVHKVGYRMSDESSNILGLLGNYFAFIFVNSLVFLSIRYETLFEGLSSEFGVESAESKRKGFSDENIERITLYMDKEKPYLNNDIHIDDLARKISLPARTFSNILNQHFNKNFFEFINTYRIEEAKRLLSEPENSSTTVLEIIHQTGFGSKSSFNSVFKQYVNMTPSEFRRNNLAQKESVAK